MSIGERIWDLRQDRRFTQGELMIKSGVDIKTIANLEAGGKSCRLKTLHKLAVAFEMTLTELFQGVDS